MDAASHPTQFRKNDMNFDAILKNILATSPNLALATSVNQQPNVRIMAFAAHPAHQGKLYLLTFKGTPKTDEFQQNIRVALTTIPEPPDAPHARIREGIISRSALTLEDVSPLFMAKIPELHQAVKEQYGPSLEVYEVAFSEVEVFIGPGQSGRIKV